MHFSTLAATALLAGTALATPTPEAGRGWGHGRGRGRGKWGGRWHGKWANQGDDKMNNGCYCLSDQDANEAASVFQELIQSYSDELALAALTEDFIDYTSSVAIIINGGDDEPVDLLAPTFDGRQAFMDAQGSQPEIPFEKLNIFHGCNSVSMRWTTSRSAKGQPTEADQVPVVGNVIIETVKADPGDEYNFRIKTIFSEFNTAAWMVNLGIFEPVEGTGEEAGPGSKVKRDIAGLPRAHMI